LARPTGQFQNREFGQPPVRPQGKSPTTFDRPAEPNGFLKLLDQDRDEFIDADEITGAADAITVLDCNADGPVPKPRGVAPPRGTEPNGSRPQGKLSNGDNACHTRPQQRA
jgi:hypothetical protein